MGEEPRERKSTTEGSGKLLIYSLPSTIYSVTVPTEYFELHGENILERKISPYFLTQSLTP